MLPEATDAHYLFSSFRSHIVTGQVIARPAPLYQTVSCCDPGRACPVLQHKFGKHVYFCRIHVDVQICTHRSLFLQKTKCLAILCCNN